MRVEDELIADLTRELEVADENFNSTLLSEKVNAVVAEVREARNYPDDYSDERIEKDMKRFYATCRKIALNDYNKIGGEYEKSRSENNVSATYVDRDALFNGIRPLSRF